MVRVDDGGGGPTLNPKAKHYERELFKVFSVQTGSIYSTQTDWQDAKKQLEDLAKDVRAVRGELQAPSDGGKGWTGPAAAAALSTLGKLSDTLDVHAGEVGDVDTSLGQVYQAVTNARSAWYSEVSSISTYVNPDDHKRLPAPYLPTAENTDKYSVRDTEAAAAAEDALWEQRNQAAKRVLDQLGTDTQMATATMPIDVKDDTQTPYTNQGPASTDRTPGSASQSTSGGYPSGGHVVGTGVLHPDDTGDDGSDDETITIQPPIDPVDPVDPDPVDPDPVDPDWVISDPPTRDPQVFDPISSDGDVTGSTGVNTGTGQGGSQGTYPTGSGGGGMGAGGMAPGGIGGAAGLGGLLRRGGGLAGGGSSSSSARGNAAGTRGSASRSGGTARGGSAVPGGAGRGGSVVPGGGGAARGGASGRTSAVKGATGAGRYGVPKLAAKGGAGVVPAGGGQAGRGTGSGKGGARSGGQAGGRAAMGAAGAGGTRKGPKDEQPQDVDKLTHEDEETWFEGTEESSPQVWQ